MTYISSSFYGHYDTFISLLKKIELKDSDSLFILGNAIGYHEDSMKLLKELSYRQNIYLIMGKEEYYAKTLLPLLKDATNFEETFFGLDDKDKEQFGNWVKAGGYNIARDFCALDADERAGILDYLEDLEAVTILEESGRTFVLAFSAPKGFDIEKDIYSYEDEDFAFGTTDYRRKYFNSSFLVTCNIPTADIPGGTFEKVYTGNKHVSLATIEPSQGRASCICLDTMKVKYTEEIEDFIE